MERSWRDAIGPGIVFAGAAVGVSHLVQATRAGASFGLGLLGVVLLANALKYPAFRFGPEYAAATGTSVLFGYRRQGRWALGLYLLLTLATMFTVLAAVGIVTAGLLMHLLPGVGAMLGATGCAAVLFAGCGLLLGVGEYRWLDRLTKVAVGIFTVATLIATVAVLPRLFSGSVGTFPSLSAPTQAMFVAGLAGWMPSAVDVSVWQSLWTLAKAEGEEREPAPKETLLDFHIGYGGTVVLALCFLCLGAGVFYESGITLADSPAAFAGQLVDVYAETLGAWSRPIVGTAAFLVMLSTTLTVADGFPRALAAVVQTLRSDGDNTRGTPKRTAYWLAMLLLIAGAQALLHFAFSSLRSLVDLATVLSFLTAPALASLNHRAMLGDDVPQALRPKDWLRRYSLLCIVLQALFAAAFLWLRFG